MPLDGLFFEYLIHHLPCLTPASDLLLILVMFLLLQAFKDSCLHHFLQQQPKGSGFFLSSFHSQSQKSTQKYWVITPPSLIKSLKIKKNYVNFFLFSFLCVSQIHSANIIMNFFLFSSLDTFFFQFVEIKINVFKRVDKKNLFQISCSDARERFQYIILLFIVFVRNMAEFSWNPGKFLSLSTC